MQSLKNKVNNIYRDIQAVTKNLFFQSLDEENKRDLYRAIDEIKTFLDNLPTKTK